MMTIWITLLTAWVMVTCRVIGDEITAHSSLGCWKLNLEGSSDNALSDLADDLPISQYQPPDESIVSRCARLAKKHGYSYFGVRNHLKCVSGVHAGFTYSKYGPSSSCSGGTGGPGAMDVYSLEGSSLLDDTLQHSTTESSYFQHDNRVLPSQDRSFIHLKPQFTMTQPAGARSSLLSGALSDPLYVSGQVKPVDIEPLYHEVDEFQYGDFIRAPKGSNLLLNPGFEQPLETSPLMGWSCQGQTDDPRGGALSKYSLDHREGQYSGICYARLAEWAGPGQYIGRKVKPKGVYSFSGWTKLLDPKHTNDYHTIELWLRYKKRDQNQEVTMRLARRDLLTSDDAWVYWKTAFQMPQSPKGFRYAYIFYRGPHKSVDIMVDDTSLIEMYQDPDWKNKTDTLIEKYRKRRIRIRVNVPPNTIPEQHMKVMVIKVEQIKHKFGFGAVANTDNLLKNIQYREFLLRNFEWIVMENAMKWPDMEPKKEQLYYKDVDKTLEILEKNNKTLRGHCIYWAVEEQLPKWLHNEPKEELFKSVKNRMRYLLGKYHGRFSHWDVNNEMLHGRFFAEHLGKPIREWMFRSAAELDPDADLFLNDFDVVANGQLTQLLVEQAKEMIERGVNIDGIGAQGHFTGPVDPFLLRLRLNALAAINRPIWLTEVDILDKNVTQRADSLEALMRMAYSHPSVSGIILWVFWAKSSWRGPDAALVDNDWKLNAAGQRYFQLLDQWTTRGTMNPTKTDANGAEVGFSGFHGEYLTTVTLPNGNFVTKKFTLDPGNDELKVEFDIDASQAKQPPLSLSDFNVVSPDKDFTHLMSKFKNELKELLERDDLKEDAEPDQYLPDIVHKQLYKKHK